MKKHIELLAAYAVQFIKVRFAYRADFLISTGASMLVTLIPFGMFNVVSLNLYNFGNDFIIEGKFDRVLLRPVASLHQVIFEVFRIESLHEVVVGLLAVWLAAT